MHKFLLPTVVAAALGLASCNDTTTNDTRASANLVNAQGAAMGTATFKPEGSSTRVQVKVSGLSAGMHGMHIHMNPACSNTTDAQGQVVVFGGAGEHFDPASAGHHGSPDTDNTKGHGGDLPMISVGADGMGNANFVTKKVSLSGPNSVIGRSIIIHAASDDYKTDPSGNTGPRERCGVIVTNGK